MTIKQAWNDLLLKLNHLPDADLDAQWILLKVLDKKESSWLIAHGEETINDKAGKELARLVDRRSKGEPLAYILGEWEFYGRSFYVTKDVLVPRPSTEQLVDQAMQYIDQIGGRRESLVIADVGTGSGCVAITLALEMDRWNKERGLSLSKKIIAIDISAAALRVARKNAARHHVTDIIDFIQGDLLDPIKGKKKIDLVVSNPPYVPSGELNVRQVQETDKVGLKFEPRIALDGGVDGLRYVDKIKTAGYPAVIETIDGEILTILR